MGEDRTWVYILIGACAVGLVGMVFAYMLHGLWHRPAARTPEQLGVSPPRPRKQDREQSAPVSQTQALATIPARPPATIVVFRDAAQASIPPDEAVEMYLTQLGLDEFLMRWVRDPRIARAVVQEGQILLTVYDVAATKVISADDQELFERVMAVIRQVQGGHKD